MGSKQAAVGARARRPPCQAPSPPNPVPSPPHGGGQLGRLREELGGVCVDKKKERGCVWIKKKERGKKKKGKTAPFKIKRRRREQKGGGGCKNR